MTGKIRRTGKRRLLCLLLAATLLCAAGILPGFTASAAGTPTSLGLAEHGIKAHRDGWKYVYGGKGQVISGAVRGTDCAGLLYSYFSDMNALGNCGAGATSQVENNCVFSNDISEGIPRIHGLALTMPDYNDPGTGIYGHIGIYIGNNEATDNSDTNYNMRREPVVGSGRNWTAWHVFDNGLKYPVNGWYALDGKMVHYTSYEYDVNTVIDGYTIGKDGYALTASGSFAPVDPTLLSTQYASASQVKAYLATKYSGRDSTYELIYGGSNDDPAPQYDGKITGSGVRLRKEPNTSSGIITTMARGTGVNILGESAGELVNNGGASSNMWYSVTTAGGYSGYVSALFVERVTPSSLSAPVIEAADGYVSITAASGAGIYYTIDGSQPDENSIPYTGPVYMTGYTYRAIAVQNGRKSPVSTATVLSNSSVFTDFTAGDWFFNAVDQAVEAQIFRGNGDGTFTPNRKITRAQFVMALANLDRVDLSPYTERTGFSDVTNMDNTMNRAIAWAADLGIVSGFPDNTFRPGETISREQMCVILANYAGLDSDDSSARFADDKKISGWAKDAVYACRDNGLVSGMGGNKFDPKGTATRAQACVLTVNLYRR